MGRQGIMQAQHSNRRFGVTAVKKGFITSDQLVEALAIQVAEDVSTGDHDLIGKILFEQGLITKPQIDEVLDSMVKNPQ
jgi:hypothetical protein